MLKHLVVGFLLGYITQISASSDNMKEMTQVLHRVCVAESGVDEQPIEDARKGTFADDPKLKCYMKCVLTKMPMMTENGDIDVETIIIMMPDEYKAVAEPTVRSCGTVKGADDCETAFLTNKCWYSKSPDIYFLI